MQAIIETGGKQYKVAEGTVLYVEKLDAEEGSIVAFDRILAVFQDGKVKVENPHVTGVTVEGKVVKQGKNKKVIVYKMHPKKNYRRKQGHRQPYTKIQIEKIALA